MLRTGLCKRSRGVAACATQNCLFAPILCSVARSWVFRCAVTKRIRHHVFDSTDCNVVLMQTKRRTMIPGTMGAARKTKTYVHSLAEAVMSQGPVFSAPVACKALHLSPARKRRRDVETARFQTSRCSSCSCELMVCLRQWLLLI